MAAWAAMAVDILQTQLPWRRSDDDICNSWFMAPRLHEKISVATSAIFLLLLVLAWFYDWLRLLHRSGSVDSQEHGFRKTTFDSTATSAVRSIVVCAGAFSFAVAAAWEEYHPLNSAAGVRGDGLLVYFIAQTSTWLVFAAACALESRHARVASSSMSRGVTRAWWMVTFLLAAVGTAMGLIRGMRHCRDAHERVALTAGTVNLLASLALVVTACHERNRAAPNESEAAQANGDAEEPLLGQKGSRGGIEGHAGASRLSRLTWRWMNALLQKGHESRLEVADVPNLAPHYDAHSLHSRYEKNWNASEGVPRNRVRKTVMRSFQKEFLQTGALALGRACVMYIGPALITSFVDFKRDQKESHAPLWQGIRLVVILVIAKSLDVTTAHHFNFQCTNLGMSIRSTLITVVYRKGVRLTNAARGVHGVGQIVNYMSVDVQVLSDVILQVHNLWLLPIQVIIALTILYSVVGWSMLAGFATMVGIVLIATWSSKAQRKFQGLIMKAKDERMKATSEALNAMKVIKLQAWESHWQSHIQKLRDVEYHSILRFMFQVLSTTTFIWCAPTIVSVVTFSCCVLLAGTQLTPGQVFTAVATFRILQEPIRNFPQTLISVSQAQVSLDRLEKYLQSEELNANTVERGPSVEGDEGLAVAVQAASFSWTEPKETDANSSNSSSSSSLRDINLRVKKGTLVAVVGTVGSGKSSLLACMLGEMPKTQGKVCVAGSTAYVPQGAWIQSGTIEENILFGHPMDRRRYDETLRICSLERDMELLEHGDQTEIGERGLNLSGGQKQRIQLARAVFQDCDIYLLDDIFSAVDAHTGSAIFQECVKGALKKKTVILVTHQIDFLHQADCILVMRDGEVAQSGKFDDLLKPGTVLEKLVLAHNDSMQLVETENSTQGPSLEALDTPYERAGASLERLASEKATSATSSAENRPAKVGAAKLVEEEQREIGRVSRSIYWLYLTKGFGPRLIIALLVVQTLWQTLMVSSDYWLAYETGQGDAIDTRRFIRVYALLGLGSWACVLLRTSLVVLLGVGTTQLFFREMLGAVFRAPMAFFDTTPSARILSRASSDQSMLDIWLAFFFGAALAVYFSLFGAIVVISQTAWPIVLVMIPLAYVYFLYQAYFIASSRELTRMDSITKAPILHHFSETVAGFMVIRCFGKEREFARANVDRVNQNARMVFHNNAATEWLGFRLEMIGNIVLCSLAFLLVVLPPALAPPQLVGLALSYGLSLNVLLYWTVWLACNLENKMVSVERIHQFTKIPSEAPLIIENCRPAADWPSQGAIEINNLQLRYRPGTPVVLKGITLKISGGEKVGVVGRTGSGKSTLIQALFRLVEASAGQIVIDGVDIATLGLSDLRSKFGIIPQEPTLFEGTVRANIDPLGAHSDNEIWECLRACQLESIIRNKPLKLGAPVADDGDDWSVGQKQLFCLGRALLKRAKILVLDEATASVDAHTDWLLQKTVQEAFVHSTVISIAHRIPTVMNCHKVLVLDAGRVKEFDSPSRLMDGSTPSLFAALVKEYTTRGHRDPVEEQKL